MTLLNIILRITFTIVLSVCTMQAKDNSSISRADVYLVHGISNLPITLTYPAKITNIQQATVVSRVSGILEKRYFKAGQTVQQGKLLYKIEDNVYKAKVNEAKASVAVAQATLNNAMSNWNRIYKLYRSKSVSKQKRDNSFALFKQAKAALGVTLARLREVQINLNYTDVKASIGGVVGTKMVNLGNFVSVNPPTKLVQITQNNQVYINFSMPMSDYIKFKNHTYSLIKQKITVDIKVHNRLIRQHGFIDFIDTNINPKTSTVKMRAIINNDNHYLMAGEFVKVILHGIVQKNIIIIPQKAVLQNPLGTIVFIALHGHVKIRPVVIDGISGNSFIIKSGVLRASDKVIVDNFFRLKPNGAVIVDKIINKQGKQ